MFYRKKKKKLNLSLRGCFAVQIDSEFAGTNGGCTAAGSVFMETQPLPGLRAPAEDGEVVSY